MADIPGVQTELPVGITGLSPTGVPTNLVGADRNGRLQTINNSDVSVFGPLVTMARIQQISADFSESIANNNITTTTTGTGTVTIANSSAVIATGTGATSSAQAQTIGTTAYFPGRETYTQFTAAYTTPTSAASSQVAGLYNGTDGLWIGYNGLSFGIATVANGTTTFVASSSFNLDTLTGASTSTFTRAGVPEAVNFTFKNVYRIRAGWLGAAPIYYEILSPDGNWVTFHMVRQPNTAVNPAFFQPSLPITMVVTKTASDATNLQITTTSWDAGAVADGEDISNSGSIAALNATVAVNTVQRQTVVANVTGTWVGTIQIQGDVGDGTWNSIYAVNTNEVSGQTITANATLIIACAGYSFIRFIATAWTSGSANVNWVATQGLQVSMSRVIGTVASGTADSGNPVKTGAVYNSSLPTGVSGNRLDMQANQFGMLAVSGRWKFRNVAGNTTVTVKSGSGTLNCIMINNATGGGVATIFDNTAGSGTIIATITLASGVVNPTPVAMSDLGLEFSTGLTVVTTLNTANNFTFLYQ